MTFRDAANAMIVSSGLGSLGSAFRDALRRTPRTVDRFRQNWTSLQFSTGPYFMFTANVEIRRREGAGLLVLDTSTTSRRAGRVSRENRTRTVLEQATGRVLESWKVSEEKSTRFLYTEDGYTVESLSPGRSLEAVMDRPEVRSQWTCRNPIDPATGDPAPILDFAALVNRLPGEPLSSVGDSVERWLATSGGPRKVQVQVTEERAGQRTVQDLGNGSPCAFRTRELLLRIDGRPEDPDRDGLIGMTGPILLWLEAGSGIPLEVSGRLPNLKGHLELELTGVAAG